MTNWNAKWIRPQTDMGDVCPVFEKDFETAQPPVSAVLRITALGVYEAKLNGQRVGDFVLAPGWTSYEHRLQYQEYDVTGLLAAHNRLAVTVGKGWYRSPLPGWQTAYTRQAAHKTTGLLAELTLTFADGSAQTVCSDESWSVSESGVRFSEIYDGETYDASFSRRTGIRLPYSTARSIP